MAMLVPRSFTYKSAPASPAPSADPEKKGLRKESRSMENAAPGDVWRGFGWRPESFHKTQAAGCPVTVDKSEPQKPPSPDSAAPIVSDETRRPSNVSLDTQQSPLTRRSTPVAVPRRGHPRRASERSPSPKDTQTLPSGTSRWTSARQQEPRRLPASVAAVLASTSIPKKKAFPKPRSTPRRMSTQQLMDEWRSDEIFEGSSSFGGSSTMDFLLSPPRDNKFLVRSDSLDSLGDISGSFSDSAPSLDIDESPMLSWSMPSTPNAQSQRKSRKKKYPLPRELDQNLDDPLSLSASDGEEELPVQCDTARASPALAPLDSTKSGLRSNGDARRPSAFKSNLTASLNSLRNSIRNSLSNFAAPTLYLPEDHLSRGLFSGSPLPYRSEMRPRPLDGPPTPELRRYLNPSSYHLPSPEQDLHMHGHGRHIEHFDLEAAAAATTATSPAAIDDPNLANPERGAVIALQPYTRSSSAPRPSEKHGRQNFSEAGRVLGFDEPQEPQYRREMRENGEFLRVCVLEMSMRRAGKFSDGVGRAKLWLPPREGRFTSAEDELRRARQGRDVPKRWIGVSA